MGSRNMEKLSEKVENIMMTTSVLHHYSMDIDELSRLKDMCSSGKDLEACLMAFNLGFAMGTRAHDRNRTPVL